MNIKFPHFYIEETESTNDLANDLLSKIKPPNGFTVITDYQSAGKGQYGRIWHSEAGKNLLFSLIVGPLNTQLNEIFKLHLVSSLAIIRALKRFNLLALTIKWPNDIYAREKKIAGILIQNHIKGSVVEWSIIGIGVNVNQQQFPDSLHATSLFLETKIETCREELLENIREQLLLMISCSNEYDWELLWKEYHASLYLKDQNVSILTKEGNNFIAIIHSVNKKGALCIQTLDKQQLEFSFGDIKYEKYF